MNIDCPDCDWEFHSDYNEIRTGMLRVHRKYHHSPETENQQ